MELYSAAKKNKITTFVGTRVDLESLALNRMIQIQKDKKSHALFQNMCFLASNICV